MRRYSLLASLLLLAVSAAFAGQPESIEQLKQRADAASPGSQPKLYLALARRHLDAAQTAFDQGNIEAGHIAVDGAVNAFESAASAAVTSRKYLKDGEIRMREMARRLDSMRRPLGIEDRERLQVAIDRMDKARNRLVNAMFGSKS